MLENVADMACRCASLDGDADRLVYFRRHGDELELFDGDRIAVLAALLVTGILKMLPATEQQAPLTVGGLSLSTVWSRGLFATRSSVHAGCMSSPSHILCAKRGEAECLHVCFSAKALACVQHADFVWAYVRCPCLSNTSTSPLQVATATKG